MRKIDACYDNPVDNINLALVEPLCPMLKKLNFTPNGITTLSLIFGLLSIYFLYIGNVYAFGILYYISYFLDCTDGHYARKYDMVTEFGDCYDHIKDAIIGVLAVGVFLYRNKNTPIKKLFPVMLVLGVALFIMVMHMGCQENLYGKDESGTLNQWRCLCPGTEEDVKNRIKWTRYFGCGTMILVTIAVIIYFEKVNAPANK